MAYKRLTKRFTGGSPYTEYASNYDILCRLAELEDKIENGTLIELPCIMQNRFGDWRVHFYSERFKDIDSYTYESKELAEKKNKELKGDNEDAKV